MSGRGCSGHVDGIPPIDVNERVNKDYETLIRPWKLPATRNICFQNVALIDTLSGTTVDEMNVFVCGGKVAHITKSSMGVPAAFDMVDCTGKYLCPGLIDNHVHLTSVQGDSSLEALKFTPRDTVMMRVAANAKAVLSRGYTTVRDCGGCEHFVRDAIEQGVFPGPRLILAAKALTQTGGHGDMRPGDLPGEAMESCLCHLNTLSTICDGVAECVRAAREQFRRGADFIKIMGGGGVASPTDRISNLQFSEQEIRAIVEVAESYGSYVTAHCYTAAAIKRCILNGVKGIEHGNLIDDETAELMARLGCYLTPTLVAYKIMASDQFKGFLSESGKAKNIEVLDAGVRSLLIAKRHGVKICQGSDLLGALNGYQTQEFFIRGKVLDADEILKGATTIPAEYNGIADKFGQVKVGFVADLLVLEKNPLQDITVLDEPETYLKLIMKGGLIYKNEIDGVVDTTL